MSLIEISSLEMITFGCPTQWTGKTKDGRSVYARYRWGRLAVNIADDPYEGDFSFSRPYKMIGGQFGDEFDGIMTNAELHAHLTNMGIVWEMTSKAQQYKTLAKEARFTVKDCDGMFDEVAVVQADGTLTLRDARLDGDDLDRFMQWLNGFYADRKESTDGV